MPRAAPIWAPDVSLNADRWHVTYSGAIPGSFASLIGLFANPAFDPNDPDFAWSNHGPVIASTGFEDWNAIEPYVLLTPDGDGRMIYGSC